MLGGLLAPLLLVALLTEGLDGIVRAFGANGRLREWMGGGLILGIFAGMLGFGVMGMAMQLGVRVPWGWLGWSGAGLVSGLILGSCGIVWIGDVVI
jgi:hypothetical protein